MESGHLGCAVHCGRFALKEKGMENLQIIEIFYIQLLLLSAAMRNTSYTTKSLVIIPLLELLELNKRGAYGWLI
jgi:hypothetical protein